MTSRWWLYDVVGLTCVVELDTGANAVEPPCPALFIYLSGDIYIVELRRLTSLSMHVFLKRSNNVRRSNLLPT